MNLADLLSDMIANGATMEHIATVVASSKRQDEARLAKQRELAAERQRQFKARKRASGNASNAGNGGNALPALQQDAPAPAQPEPTNFSKQDLLPKSPPMGGQKGKVQPARRSRIASDAQPTGADRKSADDAGMTPATFRTEWGLFRDHHVSEAASMADWQAAWRTWVGKWVKWGCKQHGAVNGNHARAGPQRSGNSTFGAMDRLMNGTPSDEPGYHPRSDWNGPEILATAKRLS